MLFTLAHTPYAAGYGEAVLPLVAAKAHLRVDGDDEDDLIGALRDAALEFVEQFCSVRLKETTGMIWRSEAVPCSDRDWIELGVGPVKEITGVKWLDSDGVEQVGDPLDFRVMSPCRALPAIGGAWPSGVAGGVELTFTAGFPPDEVPHSLLTAAKLFLGHLFRNREAVISGSVTGEIPLGVSSLCGPFRRVVI